MRLHRTRASRAALIGWLFSLPFLIIFLVFKGIPILLAAVMSLTNLRVAHLRNPLGADFIGIEGYQRLFSDPSFLRAFLNTALYVVAGVPLTMMIGLVLALVLNSGITRLKAAFRASFFAPVVTNIIAIAVLWKYAFAPLGPVNSFLESLGATGADWLGNPNTAFGVVLGLGIWRNFGICMVIFLAGLQTIPEEVREAAALDGAGSWRRLISVTLPLLRPTTLLVSILMVIAYVQIFEEPYLVTTGGPVGSTRSLALYVYEQFGYGNLATSSAASFILLSFIAVISFLQFKLIRTRH